MMKLVYDIKILKKNVFDFFQMRIFVIIDFTKKGQYVKFGDHKAEAHVCAYVITFVVQCSVCIFLKCTLYSHNVSTRAFLNREQ